MVPPLSLQEKYAIDFPSGDHAGTCSCTLSLVSRLGVPLGQSIHVHAVPAR